MPAMSMVCMILPSSCNRHFQRRLKEVGIFIIALDGIVSAGRTHGQAQPHHSLCHTSLQGSILALHLPRLVMDSSQRLIHLACPHNLSAYAPLPQTTPTT